jgi:ABC-type Na+ efflux pump permease subunit
MPEEPAPILRYATPPPRSRSRLLWRVCEILAACCFAGALYILFLSFAVAAKGTRPTPEYQQWLQMADALPPGADSPRFQGRAFTRPSVFSLPPTYIALGLFFFGVLIYVLGVLAERRTRNSNSPT